MPVHISYPCFHGGMKVNGLSATELLAGRLQIPWPVVVVFLELIRSCIRQNAFSITILRERETAVKGNFHPCRRRKQKLLKTALPRLLPETCYFFPDASFKNVLSKKKIREFHAIPLQQPLHTAAAELKHDRLINIIEPAFSVQLSGQ